VNVIPSKQVTIAALNQETSLGYACDNHVTDITNAFFLVVENWRTDQDVKIARNIWVHCFFEDGSGKTERNKNLTVEVNAIVKR